MHLLGPDCEGGVVIIPELQMGKPTRTERRDPMAQAVVGQGFDLGCLAHSQCLRPN